MGHKNIGYSHNVTARRGGRAPPDISHRETSADLLGKRGKEKRKNGEEKKENLKREGKVEN